MKDFKLLFWYLSNEAIKWMQFVSDLNFLIKMQSVIKPLSLTKTQEIGHLFFIEQVRSDSNLLLLTNNPMIMWVFGQKWLLSCLVSMLIDHVMSLPSALRKRFLSKKLLVKRSGQLTCQSLLHRFIRTIISLKIVEHLPAAHFEIFSSTSWSEYWFLIWMF